METGNKIEGLTIPQIEKALNLGLTVMRLAKDEKDAGKDELVKGKLSEFCLELRNDLEFFKDKIARCEIGEGHAYEMYNLLLKAENLLNIAKNHIACHE